MQGNFVLKLVFMVVMSSSVWSRPLTLQEDTLLATPIHTELKLVDTGTNYGTLTKPMHLRSQVQWNIKTQADYLMRFGYYDNRNPSSHDSRSSDGPLAATSLSEAFVKFQQQYRLKETGVLDNETKALMNKPRCGLPDINPMKEYRNTRRRRYIVGSRTWNGKDIITYRINNYNNDGLPPGHQNWAFRLAFNAWRDVTHLNFYRLTTPSDIEISFVEFDHGDGSPFDGFSGTLAHAFYPGEGRGGDIHIDDSEWWGTVDRLSHIAAHEIGHALGLGHSSDYSSIMFPYPDFERPWSLSDDDIAGIQDIYENQAFTETQKLTYVRTTSTTLTPSTSNDYQTPTSSHTEITTPRSNTPCHSEAIIDAITRDHSGKIHIFQGRQYYQLSSNRTLLPGFPKLISSIFPMLLCKVDAALYLPYLELQKCLESQYTRVCFGPRQVQTARFYLFSGLEYYMFEGTELDGSTFKLNGLITDLDSGITAPVDAVYTNDNRTMCFLTARQVFKVNRMSIGVGSNRNPGDITTYWIQGIPDVTIDAAYSDFSSGLTYFFSSNFYYTGQVGTDTVTSIAHRISALFS